MLELVLVRHGETAWNVDRRVQGHTDIPLNAVGLSQASRAARQLARWHGEAPFHRVDSSDLLRAAATAEPIARALGLAVQVDTVLRERHYGVLEGLTPSEMEQQRPAEVERWRAREADWPLPGGESLRGFARRIEAYLARLAVEAAALPPGERRRIVAVTHGGVLDVAYRVATGLALEAPRRHEILNASLNRLRHDGQGWRLVEWAHVEHLGEAMDEPRSTDGFA